MKRAWIYFVGFPSEKIFRSNRIPRSDDRKRASRQARLAEDFLFCGRFVAETEGFSVILIQFFGSILYNWAICWILILGMIKH